MEPVMLNFLATNENANKIRRKIRVRIAGKLLEKHESKTAIHNFTGIIRNE